MSYDYNSQDSRFDFPNPYRIENIFYFCAASILVIGGLLLLLVARGSLGSGSLIAMAPLVIGVGLLIHGLIYAAQAMSRLRFFFGRGQPANLAQELTTDQEGTTSDANAIKDLLRHNSLNFPEPTGPLNGVLYSLIPNLIYAPQHIQYVAQRQFQNALAILITLLSLAVSLVGAGKDATGWLGCFYFCMALFILLKPLETGAYGHSSLGFNGLIGLILLSVLGPVVIPMITKGALAPIWLPGMGQSALIMVVAEAAIVLFFLAVINQTLKSPPQASMAVVQGTLTMNSHPKQVLDELERRLQDQWEASLPNRRYSRLVPEVVLNAQSGSFESELLEETQPIPRSEMQSSISLESCFKEPRYRWLGWLNSYGLVVMLAAVLSMAFFAAKFFTEEGMNVSMISYATIGFSLWILGHFCFRAGNVLWGRFDFVSKLVWVEMIGNYQSAQMDYGNQFTDRVKTQKQVINIESMTLRVWIAEVETVAFGKDLGRSILGMRGLKDEANALHAHLTSFGQQQSMIVAPTSAVDLQRANALGAMNKLSSGAEGTLALPSAIAQAISAASTESTGEVVVGNQNSTISKPIVTAESCHGCQIASDANRKFCPDCGSRLALA
ncbi:hypothetical protein [Propionivibrio sp.]|uniref:hypothetical protein n=1 Tax=Propionivibrio sp. TaxID=2212460 RepID=UPI003BF12EBF